MKKRGFEVVSDFHRKFRGEIQLPKRSTKRAAAADLFSPCSLTILPGEKHLLFTDVKAYMQDDEVLVLVPRSSQGKIDVSFANTLGVVDADYFSNESNDGNIGIFLKNNGNVPYVINIGDRIGQAMFLNYLVPDEDEEITNERKGGFGSTGK